MALPTKTDLQTMDYAYGGVPFVQTAAKTGIDLNTLDYSYGGVPFWGLEVSGGGPQSYTLTCEAGSYSLTGTNADFYRALVMACNAGSYALTGSDATFNANYVFALGVGSYVLVGTSVGLFILTPTPACRTATIEFENRTFAIPHENRTLEVKCH